MTEFKRARTEEQIVSRQQEIIDACERIYTESGYDAVNFKSISEMTSVSRPSIYNYYNTKEEIFLDLVRSYFASWNEELADSFGREPVMSKEVFCRTITDMLGRRMVMLEMFSRHLSMLEINSSLERIVELKTVVGETIELIQGQYERSFGRSPEEGDLFTRLFLGFMHGLYPMSHPTEKQREAMRICRRDLETDFDLLCYTGLMRLI